MDVCKRKFWGLGEERQLTGEEKGVKGSIATE